MLGPHPGPGRAEAVLAIFLVAVQGTDGDVLPVLRVCRVLHERGHQVTVLTNARYTAQARRAGLRPVAIDVTLGAPPVSGQLVDAVMDDDPRMQRRLAAPGLLPPLGLVCRVLARRHQPGRTVLVGVSQVGLAVLTAAEALGAPAVQLAISPFHVTGLLATAAANQELYATLLDPVRAELGLAPVTDLAGWVRARAIHIGMWPDWFERAGAATPVPTRRTGFVLPDEDDDDQPPPAAARLLAGRPILVTGGSSRIVHSRFYQVAAEACAGTGRTTLLVAPHRDLAPDPLPANVHWFPRLPFRAVMPRVAAVVHHGGMGTTARALAAGTPQVILAQGYDRPDNARRLGSLGLARWLPEADWHPDTVGRLLAEALAPDPGSADRPAGQSGPDAAGPAVDALEEVAARTLPDFAAR